MDDVGFMNDDGLDFSALSVPQESGTSARATTTYIPPSPSKVSNLHM